MIISRYKGWMLLAVAVWFLYTNCGRIGFNATKPSMGSFASLSGGNCAEELKQIYANTYFPMLSVSCNRCHSNAHGSTDLDTSFQAFMAKGVTLIDYQATHPHADNGVDLTTSISAVKNTWNQGQQNYVTCQSQAPVLPPTDGLAGGALRLKTTGKIIPMVQDTLQNQNSWKTIQWDLDTEVIAGQQGQVGATLKVQARYALSSGQIVGFEFRNPSMRLKSLGKTWQVSGMNIYLNDQFQDNMTTYSSILAQVDQPTDTALAPGFANALDVFGSANMNTLVALEIINLQELTPASTTTTSTSTTTTTTLVATVTFTQLTSTDPTLGVFRRSCYGCHSGSNTAGGLNISSYASAKAAASKIVSRMNNSKNPMPTGGILSQADRDLVSKWMNAGTPQ